MTVDVWEPSAVFPDSSNYLRFDSLVYIPSPGYSGSDSYDIRVKDGWHWSNNMSSVSITVYDWALGVEESIFEFEVYPNPTSDFVQISSEKEIASFRVLDVRGREIIPPSQEKQIDLSSLEDGTYFAEVLIVGVASVSKVIKK